MPRLGAIALRVAQRLVDDDGMGRSWALRYENHVEALTRIRPIIDNLENLKVRNWGRVRRDNPVHPARLAIANLNPWSTGRTAEFVVSDTEYDGTAGRVGHRSDVLCQLVLGL